MQLDVCKLTKRFGPQAVLRDLSFSTHVGEFVAVVGPSGCGKTTLLRLIAGLEPFDSGEIRLGGQAIHGLAPRDRNVAMVFQQDSLYPHFSVRQNLEFPLRMRKMPRDVMEQKVDEIAQRFAVTDLLDRAPATLSGGQKQKVALGRAMIREPAVCLLDEPFSHLDAPIRRRFRRELLQRKAEWSGQTTILFVTHDLEEALLLGDRVAVLGEGTIQQFEAPEAVRERPASEFVADFLSEGSD